MFVNKVITKLCNRDLCITFQWHVLYTNIDQTSWIHYTDCRIVK